jgi:hypothetical protein
MALIASLGCCQPTSVPTSPTQASRAWLFGIARAVIANAAIDAVPSELLEDVFSDVAMGDRTAAREKQASLFLRARHQWFIGFVQNGTPRSCNWRLRSRRLVAMTRQKHRQVEKRPKETQQF